tara:strand:+ start:1668 stop:3362 length:1695 start_codon:yes stop_codon:yes gene_type:complete
MSFVYKNPLTSTQLTNQESVERSKVYGTNFSVLQTGGYMEVYTLNDLNFIIPEGETGLIQFTGNTIPINYSKRSLGFLPDTLNLNSDGISSGRRRLGMLVYVHETQQSYQYTIPNFDTLWDNVEANINESDFGISISSNVAGGTEFIDAWLDSSIEGVSGVTRENARWKIFWGTDWQITGGTYNSGTGTLNLDNNTGGTITVTGFTSGGGSDTTITGGTYTLGSSTLGLNDSTGGTTNIVGVTGQNVANSNLTLDGDRILTLDGNDFSLIGGTGESLLLTSTDLVLSGASSGTVSFKGITGTTETRALVINTNGVISYNDNLTGGTSYTSWSATGDNQAPVIPINVVDGFTLRFTGSITSGGAGITTDSAISPDEMTIGLVNNGGTPSSTTFYRGDGQWETPVGSDDTFITGGTYNPTTLTLSNNDGVNITIPGFAPEITGGTYSSGTITLDDNTGGSVNITNIVNIYDNDGTLGGDRIINQDSNSLIFSGGNVSIGTVTQSPVCALLELASTNQGLLIPRMTQVQRLAVTTPLPGLLLYCTDSDSNGAEGLYMYKSQGWVNVL